MITTCIIALVLSIPSPDNAYPSSGRGLAGMGRGRGLTPVATGRGLPTVATGRGLAPVGTGRGLAPVATGRGLAKVSRNPAPPPEEPPPGPASLEVQPPPPPESPVVEREATEPRETTPLSPAVSAIVKRGDLRLEERNYAAAGRQYHVAQQAQGFKGVSNLRMATAMIGEGRYFEGVNCLILHVRGGGAVTKEAFAVPKDEALCKRLDDVIERRPNDCEALFGAAVYAFGRGDAGKARDLLARIERVYPDHPCLAAFLEAVKEGDA